MSELKVIPGGLQYIVQIDFLVTVHFGKGIPSDAQGKVMLAMERALREMGYPAEVLKETMQDDSKLRRSMTPEERAKL